MDFLHVISRAKNTKETPLTILSSQDTEKYLNISSRERSLRIILELLYVTSCVYNSETKLLAAALN
jgi:hypothetical protein